MAINRPITKTIISTTAWGIPITDEVNRIASLTDSRTPTTWTNLTLVNGWANLGGGNETFQYRKVGDMVQIRGMITGGAWNTTVATLPTGFRPLGALNSNVLSQGMPPAGNPPPQLNINAAGVIAVYYGAGGAFFGLTQFSTI